MKRSHCDAFPTLSAELIARIAVFARLTPSVATYAHLRAPSDVMAICLAAGPKTSKIIRHHWLKENVSFLRRTNQRFLDGLREFTSVIDSARTYTFQSDFAHTHSTDNIRAKVRENYIAWMAVNRKWRAVITNDRIQDSKDVESSIWSTVGIVFNNPAVAIQFGLFKIVKNLVEKKNVNVNSDEFAGFGCKTKCCLLAYALGFGGVPGGSLKIFKYLLKRPGINIFPLTSYPIVINPVARHTYPFARDTQPLLGGLFQLPTEQAEAYLRSFLSHPDFDVNGEMIFVREGRRTCTTPLSFAVESLLICCMWTSYCPPQHVFRLHCSIIRNIVTAGGDPESKLEEGREAPADRIRNLKRFSEKFGYILGSREFWNEVDALFER